MHANRNKSKNAQAAKGYATVVECDRHRALVVDDEREIASLFKSFLVSALPDLTVDLAYDGKEALDTFSHGHHAVLLMDLHMPVMNGHTSVARINDLCRTRNWECPDVVFCTGFAGTDVRKRLVRDYPGHKLLAKPVMGDMIVEAIKERLNKED